MRGFEFRFVGKYKFDFRISDTIQRNTIHFYFQTIATVQTPRPHNVHVAHVEHFPANKDRERFLFVLDNGGERDNSKRPLWDGFPAQRPLAREL